MSDYCDIATRVAPDSDIVRLAPGKLVQFFISGTATLQAEANADAYGRVNIASLPTGKYDVKVDGQIVKTIQHILADHTHQADRTLTFFVSGAVTGDANESNTQRVYGVSAAAKIIAIRVIAETITNVGDVTVHILRGSAGGAAQLTFAADSQWSQRLYVGGGSTVYRHMPAPATPDIQLNANDTVTIGIDHVADGVSGITVELIVRPD
jgi:hypothetical protein